VGYCTLNEKGLILEANLRASTLLGVPRGGLVGQSISLSILLEDQNLWYRHLQKLFKTNEPQDFELRMARKPDGAVLWVRLDATIAHDENGISTSRVTLTDISTNKRAEEKIKSLIAEKELILKEVHHRIKNNMNTLHSLFALQAGTLKNQEAIAAIEDAKTRVRSMMVIYDKLYQAASFDSISLAHYLPSLLDDIIANFANSPSVRLEKKIEDVTLDVKKAQTLGIVINELLTNIMKYAFVGKSDGLISVSVSLKDKTVFLAIQDNGVGLPESVSFEDPSSFGLMVVGTLTRQLEGTIRVERGNGTRILLEFER